MMYRGDFGEVLSEGLHAVFSKRFLSYGFVGLSGVIVNMAVLAVLREGLNMDLTWSAVIGVELAVVNNFLWNDVWTFRDISRRQSGWYVRIKRFFRFNTISLSGLVLNVATIHLLVNVTAVSEYLAAFVAIGLVTVWNFILNVKFSWSDEREAVPFGCLK